MREPFDAEHARLMRRYRNALASDRHEAEAARKALREYVAWLLMRPAERKDAA